MRICCSTAKDQRHNHFVKALLCLSNGSGWHAWYDRRLMLGCEATNKAYDSKINNKYRFEIVRISYRYVKRRIWQNLNSEQKLVEKMVFIGIWSINGTLKRIVTRSQF